MELPQWLSGKESACNAGVSGDAGLITGLGRSHGGEHGNPLQYSCPENPMDRGAWRATVHGVTQSWTRLKDLAHTHMSHMTGRRCVDRHTGRTAYDGTGQTDSEGRQLRGDGGGVLLPGAKEPLGP